MAYSKAKLKSNGDKPLLFEIILTRKYAMSDGTSHITAKARIFL